MLEKQVYELDNIVNKDKYKNEINLIYNTYCEKECQIFGDKFVEKNNNNIELNIKGDKSKLVSKYKLKKGNTLSTALMLPPNRTSGASLAPKKEPNALIGEIVSPI